MNNGVYPPYTVGAPDNAPANTAGTSTTPYTSGAANGSAGAGAGR